MNSSVNPISSRSSGVGSLLLGGLYNRHLAEVKRNGRLLLDVPEALKTHEMCLAAARSDSQSIRFLPNGMDESTLRLIYSIALKKDPLALKFVPDKFKTQANCLAAVQEDGGALLYVPDELKTAHLCAAAVLSKGEALGSVPDSLKTPEMCLKAVEKYGLAISFVPPEMRTYLIYLEAVRGYGVSLREVPVNFHTSELCLAALRRNIVSIVDVDIATVLECYDADEMVTPGDVVDYINEKWRGISLILGPKRTQALADVVSKYSLNELIKEGSRMPDYPKLA